MSTSFWGSGLFSSSSSGSGLSGLYGALSDRATIKNGSYKRLLTSYYSAASGVGSSSSSSSASSSKSKTSNVIDKILEQKKNPTVSKSVQEANANLTEGLSNMKTSVTALQNSKTYTDTENGQSATDKVTSAMKAYVSDYNNVVKAAKGSTLTNKTAYVANMMSSTAKNADKLAEVGVTINYDGTLDIDEKKLKEAGVSKVQELFSPNDITSYGSMVASRVQFAGSAAGTSSSSSSTGTSSSSSSAAASSAASLKADGKELASDALYEKVKDKDGKEAYDVEKIFATAKSFVDNYNNMFDKAESSFNSGVVANLANIKDKTSHYADSLKEIGITVNSKGRLSIDEDTFKNSDMSKVQKLFKDYGSSVATNASLVDYYMTTQANATSGYTAAGAYNVQGSALYTGSV